MFCCTKTNNSKFNSFIAGAVIKRQILTYEDDYN